MALRLGYIYIVMAHGAATRVGRSPIRMVTGRYLAAGHEITHGFDDQGRKYDMNAQRKVKRWLAIKASWPIP